MTSEAHSPPEEKWRAVQRGIPAKQKRIPAKKMRGG
jgi:hypothetical protein